MPHAGRRFPMKGVRSVWLSPIALARHELRQIEVTAWAVMSVPRNEVNRKQNVI